MRLFGLFQAARWTEVPFMDLAPVSFSAHRIFVHLSVWQLVCVVVNPTEFLLKKKWLLKDRPLINGVLQHL